MASVSSHGLIAGRSSSQNDDKGTSGSVVDIKVRSDSQKDDTPRGHSLVEIKARESGDDRKLTLFGVAAMNTDSAHLSSKRDSLESQKLMIQ